MFFVSCVCYPCLEIVSKLKIKLTYVRLESGLDLDLDIAVDLQLNLHYDVSI